MKLTTNGRTVALASCRLTADGCVLVTAEPVTPGSTLLITADNGMELRRYTVADWLRCEADGCTLTLSDRPAPAPAPVDLDAEKVRRIRQSNDGLEDYLLAHPLQWTDGAYYAITQKKQNQLTSKISVAQAKMQLGIPYELKWNTTGEVCAEWELADLMALAFAIDERVTKLVEYQQVKEIEIRNAATIEELNTIEVDYDTVG